MAVLYYVTYGVALHYVTFTYGVAWHYVTFILVFLYFYTVICTFFGVN